MTTAVNISQRVVSVLYYCWVAHVGRQIPKINRNDICYLNSRCVICFWCYPSCLSICHCLCWCVISFWHNLEIWDWKSLFFHDKYRSNSHTKYMPMEHHEKKGDNRSIMLIEVSTCTKYQILTCICSIEKKEY